MLPWPGHLLPTFRIAAKFKIRFPEFHKDIAGLGFDFSTITNELSKTGFGSGSMFETQRAGSSIYRSLIATLAPQKSRQPSSRDPGAAIYFRFKPARAACTPNSHGPQEQSTTPVPGLGSLTTRRGAPACPVPRCRIELAKEERHPRITRGQNPQSRSRRGVKRLRASVQADLL